MKIITAAEAKAETIKRMLELRKSIDISEAVKLAELKIKNAIENAVCSTYVSHAEFSNDLFLQEFKFFLEDLGYNVEQFYLTVGSTPSLKITWE
jgi:hypothetical protein